MNQSSLNLNLPLTRRLNREISAEIADHLACVAEEDETKKRELLAKLESSDVKRKLAAPHLTDQVTATLWRWPVKSEWTEFAWLLFWYALVFLSDYIAAGRAFNTGWPPYYARAGDDPALINKTALAWGLSAIARAGFYVQFTITLVRSYRAGFGVLIARLIQLKLIHSMLVAGGFLLLPGLAAYSWPRIVLWEWKPGAVLNDATIFWGAIAIIAVIAVIAVTKPVFRRHLWAPALFVFLIGLFLYQGSPAKVTSCHVVYQSNATAKIGEVDSTQVAYRPISPFYSTAFSPGRSKRVTVLSEKVNESWRSAPFVRAGAGLGWLAFPIPLMGLLSLLAMWWILGRRSVWDAVLYGVMVWLAFWGTIGPFVFGSANPFASAEYLFVANPAKCFEIAFSHRLADDSYLVAFAFLFGAILPWAMVAMFARAKREMEPGINERNIQAD